MTSNMEKKTVAYIVRTDVLRALLNDPSWLTRFNEAKSVTNEAKVVEAYCKAHGIDTGDVMLPL